MIKNESDILAYIQKNINTTSKNVIKSIGDDCAVIKLSTNKSLVITTDTSLLGPHFTKNYSPATSEEILILGNSWRTVSIKRSSKN